MPAPAVPRGKLTFQGNVGPTAFATSVWMQRAQNQTPSGPTTDDFLTAVRGEINSNGLGADFTAQNSTTCVWSSIRVDWYLSNSNASVSNGELSVGPFAGSSDLSSPASTSMVATLLTGRQSKSGRGRMYWPATLNLPNTSPFQFPSSWRAAMAADLADLFTFINGLTNGTDIGDTTVVVNSPTLGVVTPVTAVRIDSIPDRQEHREKGLTPSLTVAAVT